MTDNEPTCGQVMLARDKCELLRGDLNYASALNEGSPERGVCLARAEVQLSNIARLMGYQVSKIDGDNNA